MRSGPVRNTADGPTAAKGTQSRCLGWTHLSTFVLHEVEGHRPPFLRHVAGPRILARGPAAEGP